MSNDSYWELCELNPNAVLYPEYEEAYIGWVCRSEDEPPVACYLYDGILSILLEETMYEVMQEKEFETEDEMQEAMNRGQLIVAGKYEEFTKELTTINHPFILETSKFDKEYLEEPQATY
jgi:hypothetical protein|tara:strand:- start:2994 stop:3353 length:360 start_codon:yes stop_codon:yes gene_type:complete